MPDLDKRKAAAKRARDRRKARMGEGPRTCVDCGATFTVADPAHDLVRCEPCMRAYNDRIRREAGYRPDGRAA